MRQSFIIPLCSILLLAGCAKANERQVLEHIEKANYCDTKEDCTLIGSKCPFDCYIYVNNKEAGRVKEMVDSFQTTCTFSCMQSEGVECQEGKCKALTPISMETAGNVGAECKEDSECITPLSYLSRSVCPFGAMCIDGRCAVVCPQTLPAENPRMDGYQMVACKQDSDCDCKGFAADDKFRCACEKEVCLAVMQ